MHKFGQVPVRIRKMVFCSEGFAKKAFTLHFSHMIQFMYERFKTFQSTKIRVGYIDPILSFFKLITRIAEKFSLETRIRQRHPRFNLFVYGVLMNKEILAERLRMTIDEINKEFRFRKAVLKGWKRIANVYSYTYQGYVFNLCKDEKSSVEGILISGLTYEDLLRLDQYEVPYTREEVSVFCNERPVKAFVYVYKEKNAR